MSYQGYKERILAVFQEMEEMTGPTIDEYIDIMGEIAVEAEMRTRIAIDVRDNMPESVGEEFIDKARQSYISYIDDLEDIDE